MMWQTPEERLALLELLVRGALRRRRAQATAYDALAELPWTRVTGRRDEIGLVEERRHELVALIERVWPAWVSALAELTARGLPPTPDGWGRLEDARRAEGLPALPEVLNRRTAAALAAPHSKATLTDRRLAALGDTEPTHDGTVRLRPPRGLVARTRGGIVDLAGVAGVLGEVAIPERAFREGLRLEGAIRAVLLIENLGAWRDLPEREGWLFAHVPGWDTVTVDPSARPRGNRAGHPLRRPRPERRPHLPALARAARRPAVVRPIDLGRDRGVTRSARAVAGRPRPP